MTSKKHRMIIYGVAIQLLLVAIVCYAAFPIKTPEKPIRIMYHTNAGKVLFDHQTHASVNGYALNCEDCHHPHGGEEMEPVSCVTCHPPKRVEGEVPESCLECHDKDEVVDSDLPNEEDAFHEQCWQCHEQFGAGPGPGPENCSKCHVL